MKEMNSTTTIQFTHRLLLSFGLILCLLLYYLEPVHANGGGGNVYIEPSVTLVYQSIKINPGTYMTYTLDSLTPSAKVGIKINVTGGMNNDIFVYFLDYPHSTSKCNS